MLNIAESFFGTLEEEGLTECLREAGFTHKNTKREDLPNGKALVRLDYKEERA